MSRTKRKRKAKQKLKIIRKRKAGKLVRFVLTVYGKIEMQKKGSKSA